MERAPSCLDLGRLTPARLQKRLGASDGKASWDLISKNREELTGNRRIERKPRFKEISKS